MNRYSVAVLALCFLVSVMSAWDGDWNCLMVAVIGVAVTLAPMRATGDPDAGYDPRLMFLAIIPLVALAVLFVADPVLDLAYYYPISVAAQAGAGLAFGLMVAVYLNARRSVSLPRRWVVLFALVFACSLSALHMVSTIYWMASTGFPLHNDDFTNTLENNVVNMMLMLPMAVTVFATFIYAFVVNAYLKRADRIELAGFRGGP